MDPPGHDRRPAGTGDAAKQLPTLLPRPPGSPPAGAGSAGLGHLNVDGSIPIPGPPMESRTNFRPRRHQVSVACNNCRVKRLKCDGNRPICARCSRSDSHCVYEAEMNETYGLARKRKYEQIRGDLDDMNELYNYLRTKSHVEATEILRRVRLAVDPRVVLRFIRDGDLLMEASLAARRGADPAVIAEFDDEAYQRSSIKVRAQPWTVVAGDGLVSELVSIFFETEHPFLLWALNKEAFLEEMASASVAKSSLCTPLLVNAICALGAFTSPCAKSIDGVRGIKIQEEFMIECKRLLELEDGKATLSTSVSLFAMYICCSGTARDRAGSLFRYSSCGILNKLIFGKQDLSDERWNGKQSPSTVSQAGWGLFCLEIMTAFLYDQQPLMRVPRIPKIFRPILPLSQINGESDRFWILQCIISELFWEVSEHSEKAAYKVETEQDTIERFILHQKYLSLRVYVLQELDGFKDSHGREYFLRSYLSAVAISLFRPLQDLGIESGDASIIPCEITIQACNEIVIELQKFSQLYPIHWQQGSMTTIWFCYTIAFCLVRILDKEPNSHKAFTFACQHFHDISSNYSIGAGLLTGLQAVAQEWSMTFPKESQHFFVATSVEGEKVEDVPIGYVIPQHGRVVRRSQGENDGKAVDVEIGQLISKWKLMTIQ